MELMKGIEKGILRKLAKEYNVCVRCIEGVIHSKNKDIRDKFRNVRL